MKAYKLTLVFSVLIMILVSVAWIFDFLPAQMATETAAKLIGVVLVTGIGSGIMMAVMGNREESAAKQEKKDVQGPQF